MASVACLGLRRMADGFGGHRRRGLRAVRAALAACLPCGDGRGGSVIFSLISSAHPIGYGPPGHLIGLVPGSSHRRGGASFPFRPTPSRLLFSACLPWLVPPSSAGGCAGCGMACGGGRRGLLACVLISRSALSLPLVRSLLYASCRSCRCACPGRCGAFYGLFLPLTCRRWRF